MDDNTTGMGQAKQFKSKNGTSAYDKVVRRREVRGPDECWPISGRCAHGWPMVLAPQADGKQRGHHAARVILEVEVLKRPIAPGMQCNHRCKTGPNGQRCGNPAHLYEGTPKQNMEDRDRDGTTARGDRCGNAKLTDAQALEIYHAIGKYADIAAPYGVTRQTVKDIKRGRTWAYLTQSLQQTPPPPPQSGTASASS